MQRLVGIRKSAPADDVDEEVRVLRGDERVKRLGEK